MRLQLDDIHKRFGENEVLRGIDLSVESGQILALVGENGPTSRHLTRVISGAHQPNAGVLIIDGDEVRFNKPQDAMAAGIRVIYQEFRLNLFPPSTWPRTFSCSTSEAGSADCSCGAGPCVKPRRSSCSRLVSTWTRLARWPPSRSRSNSSSRSPRPSART